MARFTILPKAQAISGSNVARLIPCAACDVRELAICDALKGTEIDRMAEIVIRMPAPAVARCFRKAMTPIMSTTSSAVPCACSS